MKYTQNYNLRKPEDTDPADIQDLNYNADVIDGKLREIEDWEAAHLQASNPHGITPEGIGAETPTGAQQKAYQAETNAKSYADIVANSALNSAKDYADDVLESANGYTDQVASNLSNQAETNAKAYTDAHEQKAAPHSGHETPAGAQEKANAAASAALTNANNYTDTSVTNALNEAKNHANNVSAAALASANNYTDQTASNLNQKIDETRIKILDVQQDLSNLSRALTNLNPNQEAKQSVSGYGILSLPKNAANGQISVVAKGLTATNLVKNGDFANGTTNWSVGDATISASQNVLMITGTGTGIEPRVSQQLPIKRIGQKLYVRMKAKVTNSECKQIRLMVGALSVVQANPVANTEYLISGVLTMANDGSKVWCVPWHGYNSAEAAAGKVMEVKEVMVIDLTATFGAGNEPDKETCDKIFANWFDATKSTISAMRVKAVGKNLAKNTGKRYRGYTTNNGTETLDNNNVSWFTKENFRVQPNTTYRFIVSDGVGGFVYYKDKSKQWIGREAKANRVAFTTPSNCYYVDFQGTLDLSKNIADVQLILVREDNYSANIVYEPYIESVAYGIAKDPTTDEVLQLRSLPNGVKDEIRVSENKLIKRIGDKTNVASGTVIDYSDMITGGQFVAYASDGTNQVGVKGDTLTITATTLIYQLATPIEIPIQASGSLVSYPSGTVYIEPFVADAGIYTDKMSVLHQDLPIKALEKLSKIDFMTGIETELDVSDAVIAEDKLSFTHPDLEAGDIVFFVYEYDRESTVGETEIEYYDSRYVIKDSVTGKFYKWHIAVADGVPSIELTEV